MSIPATPAGAAVKITRWRAVSFASSAFVPVDTFPVWLETIAEVNPITHFVDAIRVLTLDVDSGTSAVQTQRPVLMSIAWIIAVVAVFAPLAVRAYQKKTT